MKAGKGYTLEDKTLAEIMKVFILEVSKIV